MPAIQRLELEIDGTRLSGELLGHLSELEVAGRARRPSGFALRFEPGSSARLLKGVGDELAAALTPGGELVILYGNRRLREIFRGRIGSVGLDLDSANDSGSAFVVQGHDHGERLTRRQSVRTFESLSASEIAREIANEHGLEAKVGDAPKLSRVVQAGETDWDFLARLAAEGDHELWVEGKTLFFGEAGRSKELDLTWGRGLVGFAPTLTLSDQVSEVRVRGWNPETKEAVVGTASADPKIRDGSVHEIRGRVVRSENEARRIAQSVAREAVENARRARGEVQPGLPELQVGRSVSVQGVGKEFSGAYRVSSVVHRITPADGYITVWEAGEVEVHDVLTPGGSSPSVPAECCGQPSVAVAIVIDNQHPDAGQAGVRVSFPWLSEDDESDWLRVAAPMAGDERGLYFLPEIGDEVLVAFEHGDLEHPFVIGSLWNGVDRPPVTNESGDNDLRVLHSRSGHRIVFDDTAGEEKIRIEDRDGNRIVLDSDHGELVIESQGDLRLEANGDLVLQGSKISLTASGDIEAEAGSDIELDAGSDVEVNAGANATVKAQGTARLEGGAQGIVEAPFVKIN